MAARERNGFGADAIRDMGLNNPWLSHAAEEYDALGGASAEGDSSGGSHFRASLHNGQMWLTLAIESGASQSLPSLRAKGQWWFAASNYHMKVVTLVKLFSTASAMSRIEMEQWVIGTGASGPQRSGTTTTRQASPAAAARQLEMRQQLSIHWSGPAPFQQTPVVQQRGLANFHVTGAPLVVRFEDLMGRPLLLADGEHDIIVAEADLQDNPATGQEIVQVAEARRAFNDRSWADADPTYRQAANLDFPGSVGTLKYYAGWIDKLVGLTSFNIPGAFAYTRREPGRLRLDHRRLQPDHPVELPLLIFTWKIPPAVAMGNTVVIKSAEATPLLAVKMCELIREAGFPAGTVNLISGFGKTAGSALVGHMDVDKVAFTGPTATGRAILQVSAASNLKRVTLELGGKSPNIVFADADLDRAAVWSAWGINMNFGQTCQAGTRLYVHEDVYDVF
ncbi:hypothetical protein SCUCBS95973_001014 [Sporothrix curviconia]|uniref:aldehyde dehydrogenase (NAD(+)) n=1 Tax=Sporothrix curviconia TaxID=1260050 RepID=A0ABP0AUY9_9PEZI